MHETAIRGTETVKYGTETKKKGKPNRLFIHNS